MHCQEWCLEIFVEISTFKARESAASNKVRNNGFLVDLAEWEVAALLHFLGFQMYMSH